jgi:hypothetical protein
MEAKKLAAEYRNLSVFAKIALGHYSLPCIIPETMPETLKALSTHGRADKIRFARCAKAINKDLRNQELQVVIKGSQFKLFYAGLPRIYISGDLTPSPISKLRNASNLLVMEVYRQCGTTNVSAIAALEALDPLPKSVKYAVGDCIRGSVLGEKNRF